MKILEFLAELATDTEVMCAYRNDPHTVLCARGLSEPDQRLLLSGDPIALRMAVAAAAATQRSAGRWRGKSPGPPNMEMFSPNPDAPEAVPEEFPSPPAAPPPVPPEEFPSPPPPPPPPDVRPEEFPSAPPAQPEVWPSGEIPPRKRMAAYPPSVMAEEFPQPEPEPEPPQNSAASHRAELEIAEAEPLDLELDLAQDAVLTGLPSDRAADSEPGGVWGTSGLTVVGMGIRAGLHITQETRLAIQQASKVLYLVADAISEACILKLHPGAESLGPLYETGKPRIEIYENIIARILSELEQAGNLCVAFYGHPGVLSYPAWESIRRARATGKRARMLPAISTEDSLYADLGIDIGRAGMQSFESTRFLYYKYNFDPRAALVLWQVSVLGENEWNPPHLGARPRLQVLAEYLEKFYAPEHEVFLYHAPEYPTSRPLVERLRLRDLPQAEFVSISTLYVPPAGKPERNEENIQALARVAARK